MDVSQPAPRGKRTGRKWAFALGALAALAGLYSAGWYFASTKVHGRLLAALAGQDDRALKADCRNPRTGGFPFSLSLHCSALAADDTKHGISTTLGPAEARVSLFSPNSVHSTVKGPVEIRSTGGLLVGEWQALTSDVTFGLSGMQSIAVDADGIKANFTDPARGDAVQTLASRFNGATVNDSGDLKATMAVDGMTLSRNGTALPLPPLNVDAAVTVAGRGDLVGRFDRSALYGTQGEIARFTANLGEGRDATLTGPFSIDEEGRISGKLKLEAKNIAAWLDAAEQAVPEIAPLIESAGSLIRSYTKGNPDLSLDLTLKRGKVLVAGFIPVGEIPPL